MEAVKTSILQKKDFDTTKILIECNSKKIHYLEIRSWFQSNEIRSLLNTIVTCNNLTNLHRLSFIETSDSIHKDIAHLIRCNIPCLERIDLGNSSSRWICATLSDALVQNSSLKVLSLNNCCVGNDGAKIMAQILNKNNCTLESLLILGCGIRSEGCCAMMDSLPFNSSLKVLNLSCNNINAEGCIAIGKALRNPNVTLESLCLANNIQIGSIGCVSIANALIDNSSLKVLNVSQCKIGNEGAEALAMILNSNQTVLEELIVRGNNQLNENGFIFLAHALLHNTTLKSLKLPNEADFYSVVVRRSIGNRFEMALQTNYTLQNLSCELFPNNIQTTLKHHLDFNKQRPVEAEATKTGVFPHRLLLQDKEEEQQQQEGYSMVITMPSCRVEALAKVVAYKSISVLFSFIQDYPFF